jgi:hypothetical protein
MWLLPLLALLVTLFAPQRRQCTASMGRGGKTRSGNPVFVDRRTVKTGSDRIINATIRVVYTTPVKTPKGNLTASRAVAMFDCEKMTFATKENATYIDERTNNVFQRTVNKQPGFGPAISGNFADVALQHFCKR